MTTKERPQPVRELPGAVEFSKTISESDTYLFAGITGDFYPVHIDAEYASRQPVGQRIAHGILSMALLSTVSAMISARARERGSRGTSVSLGYDRIRFLKPVFIGDTLTARYTIVALDAKAGKCFGFNEVATSVWRSLEEPKSFNELRDELLDEYDVVEGQCTRELQELLEDLISKQLIEKSQSEGNKLR